MNDQSLIKEMCLAYDGQKMGDLIRIGLIPAPDSFRDIKPVWRSVYRIDYKGMHPALVLFQKMRQELQGNLMDIIVNGVSMLNPDKGVTLDSESVPAMVENTVRSLKNAPKEPTYRGEQTFGRPSKYDPVETILQAQEYLDSCQDTWERVPVKQYDTTTTNKDPETGEITKETKTHTDYEMKLAINLPTIEGLALHLKVRRDTLYEWEKTYSDFSDIMETVRAMQAGSLIRGGLSGRMNSTITKVMLTKHGYREGIEQSAKDGEDLFKGMSDKDKAEYYALLFPNGPAGVGGASK